MEEPLKQSMTMLRIVFLPHVVAALGLTIVAASKPARSFELLCCMCLLASQASLVGIWVAPTIPKIRLLALFCGATATLILEISFAAKIDLPWVVALVLAPVAGLELMLGGTLLAARCCNYRLMDVGQTGSSSVTSVPVECYNRGGGRDFL
ncbi:MAG TPA: hypothetical protein PK867_28525 [Pirellulales bacterium]|nr:hypothetical protein [Pirellulales bacterium]